MKKMTLKMRLLGGLVIVSMLFAASCAQGFDESETFISTVTNAQVESPELTEANFSTVANADLSESVKVEWKVVPGACGYECKVNIVDDPENPIELVNETIDGCSFLFDKLEDTKYEVSVRALGNAALNNKDAAEAGMYAYSTLVPAVKVPADYSGDLAVFIKEHLDPNATSEQAFELAAGGNYTIESVVDFGRTPMTFRGDKVNRPIVTLGRNGVIRTASSLKVKFIKFNCEDATASGVIEGSYQFFPDMEAASGEGYQNPDPIVLQDCWFRQVNQCLIYSGDVAWSLADVRIVNCIVQLCNDGSDNGDAAVISGYSRKGYFKDDTGASTKWRNGIRDITVKNSTLYNTKGNSKNRMIRFNGNNLSNVWGSKYGSATFENCTISQIMTNKEFANGTPNTAEYTITFNNNVLYDCWRLQKFIQGSNTKNVDKATNAICGITNTVDSTDAEKYATEEVFAFEGDHTQSLNLEAENGGVNFKATGALSSTVGDPRWL